MYWLATVAQMQVVRREKRHHREQQGRANDQQQLETPTRSRCVGYGHASPRWNKIDVNRPAPCLYWQAPTAYFSAVEIV